MKTHEIIHLDMTRLYGKLLSCHKRGCGKGRKDGVVCGGENAPYDTVFGTVFSTEYTKYSVCSADSYVA